MGRFGLLLEGRRLVGPMYLWTTYAYRNDYNGNNEYKEETKLCDTTISEEKER